MRAASHHFEERGRGDGAVMSFPEIGRRIGVSGRAALYIYRNALKKLQQDSAARRRLKALFDERERLRSPQVDSPKLRPRGA